MEEPVFRFWVGKHLRGPASLDGRSLLLDMGVDVEMQQVLDVCSLVTIYPSWLDHVLYVVLDEPVFFKTFDCIVPVARTVTGLLQVNWSLHPLGITRGYF